MLAGFLKHQQYFKNSLKVDGTWKLRLAAHIFSDDVPTNFVEMIGSFAQNDQVIYRWKWIPMNFNIHPDLFKKSFKTQWLKCIYIYTVYTLQTTIAIVIHIQHLVVLRIASALSRRYPQYVRGLLLLAPTASLTAGKVQPLNSGVPNRMKQVIPKTKLTDKKFSEVGENNQIPQISPYFNEKYHVVNCSIAYF